MRKFFLGFILTSLLITTYAIGIPNANSYANAQAEIAMELTTGTVLTESNADAKLPMASTTKILTAIIIIEDCDINQVITVPEEAVGEEGSSIYLKKGEEIDIRDLLYGLMLRSGNDSAAALAIHHSGSIEKFAEVMNKKARELGAENSNFKNPSGLPDNEHYTTARDLCKIACYAMKNDTFKAIVSTTTYKGKYRSFTAKNKILNLYKGANGVKTGYTVKAGRCLVSSAERDGMDIVCVVLNCPEMYERSCAIFDSCFENYKLLKLDENKVFMCGIIPCKLLKTHNLVIRTNSKIDYKVNYIENDASGSIAELEIFDKNNLIFSEKLYSIIDN